MTVKEAAIEVLRSAGRPLTVLEILTEIQARDLFQFRPKGQRSIVLATLKRHAENAHSCTPAKTKVFRQVAEGEFELL